MAALLFPSTEALKVELEVVCVLSDDKRDLSYQTNVYSLCMTRGVCVCGLCICPTHCVGSLQCAMHG